MKNTWKDIIFESGKFKNPVHFKGFFDEAFVLESDLNELIDNFIKDTNPIKKNSLRFYSDGRQDEFEDMLCRTEIKNEENCNDWILRNISKPNYGFVLNRAEKWSEVIATKIAEFSTQICDFFDSNKIVVETVLFMGNYGYSPFGVHIDEGDTYIFHIHLGPNKKKMMLWTPEEYLKANNSLCRNFRPDSILPSGTVYEYEQQDLFFFPGNLYHVGLTEEYSAMLAVVVTLEQEDAFIQNFINSGIQNLLRRNKDVFQFRDIGLSDWLKTSEFNFNLKRASNNYLLASPLELIDIKVDENDVFILSKPFKIQFNLSGVLHVFLRGYHITFDPHPALDYLNSIIRLIELLNEGQPCSARYVYKLFPSFFDNEAVNYILSEFLKYRAIRRFRDSIK